MRHHAITGYTTRFKASSAGASAWLGFGPCKGANFSVEATWSGTTNGTNIKVQGALSSASTSPLLIAQVKSSQKSVQVASTSGVSAKWISYIRFLSSGVLSTAKFGIIWVAATP